MKRRIIAIITARGGSKGLPRKNILDLNGKPLIAYTINAAIKSNIFSKVVVSTDDNEIKNISLIYGAEVIDRPSFLATDTASSLDVLEHTLLKLQNNKDKYTHFILLQPTSPLRNARHIIKAYNKYCEENVNSLVSVSEVEHPPQKMLIEENGEIKPLTKWEDLIKPRQQLAKAYQPNGAIYICHIEMFLNSKNIFEKPLSIFKMNCESSIDIDSKKDLNKVKGIING